MKKVFLLTLLSVIIVCVVVGLLYKKAHTSETIAIGTYVLDEGNEPLKPHLTLQENNKFMFIYSGFSSYIPTGTYETAENNLILTTDDGKYKYVFKINKTTLIFNKKESSTISLGVVKDNSEFILINNFEK